LAHSVTSTIAGAALALAVSTVGVLGATGTAYAAVPGHVGAASSISPQNPGPPHQPGPPHPAGPQHAGPPPQQANRPSPTSPPHRFHSRFHTQQQCQSQAQHDHPGHPELWDCRRGTDHNNPWEYWGS